MHLNARSMNGLLCVCAGAMIASPAVAEYQGLQVQLHTQVIAGGQMRNVYRVYVTFDNENDFVSSVCGHPTYGAMTIQSRNADDTAFGGVFFNPIGGGALAPTAAGILQNPDVEWDTFATMGVAIQDLAPPPGYQTGQSPGFQGFGDVNQYTTGSVGWFNIPPYEQCRAGFLGDGDPELRVLVMQLTVAEGENVRGTVSLFGGNLDAAPGEGNFAFGLQTFNSFPAPGGLAVVAFAVMCGSRARRRTSVR